MSSRNSSVLFPANITADFVFNKDEIDEIAFWDMKKIKEQIGKNVFSGHFEKEISLYLKKK